MSNQPQNVKEAAAYAVQVGAYDDLKRDLTTQKREGKNLKAIKEIVAGRIQAWRNEQQEMVVHRLDKP